MTTPAESVERVRRGLAIDFDERRRVARDSDTPPDLLSVMSSDETDDAVAAAIAANPRTPVSALRLLHSRWPTDRRVNEDLAGNPTSPLDLVDAALDAVEAAWKRCEGGRGDALATVAERTDLTVDLAGRLISYDDDQAYYVLVQNPQLPPEAFALLPKTGRFKSEVAIYGSSNPAAPGTFLRWVYTEERYAGAARHRNCPVDLVLDAANATTDGGLFFHAKDRRLAAAGNPCVPVEALETLRADLDARVRKAAWINPRTSLETCRSYLAASDQWDDTTLCGVVANPHTSLTDVDWVAAKAAERGFFETEEVILGRIASEAPTYAARKAAKDELYFRTRRAQAVARFQARM